MENSNITEELDKLTIEVDRNITLQSVILSQENKNKINAFIKEMRYREEFEKYGLEPMNRILMYGASGCGKTQLGKALSNHLKYRMLYIDIDAALNRGNASENITKVFEIANELKKCIVFLDECDSVAWSRDTKDREDGNVRRATNSLFQCLDRLDTSNIFISATNMVYRLDPAFERRFQMKMEFMRPTEGYMDIVKKFVKPQFKFIDDVDKNERSIIETRMSRSDKLSIYGIQCCVERAMKNTIMLNSDILKTSTIYKVLKEYMNIKTDSDMAPFV